MTKRFLFDLDETLINTTYLFSSSITDFCVLIYSELKHKAPYILQIIEFQKEFDLKNIKDHGFGEKERFAESLIQTYHKICSLTKTKTEESLEQKIFEIGLKPYNYCYNKNFQIEGVIDVLDFLKQKKDELYLVTLGVESFQKQKVKSTGLSKYFSEEKIFVEKREKTGTFKKLSKNFSKEKVIVVGDSEKSDILAAQNAGLKAVHVLTPTGSWAYDESKKEIEGKVIKISNIKKLIEIYDTL